MGTGRRERRGDHDPGRHEKTPLEEAMNISKFEGIAGTRAFGAGFGLY